MCGMHAYAVWCTCEVYMQRLKVDSRAFPLPPLPYILSKYFLLPPDHGLTVLARLAGQ